MTTETLILDQQTKFQGLQRSRSLPQGDPASAPLEALVLDEALKDWATSSLSWAWRLDDFALTHLLFSDNMVLCSASVKGLQTMTEQCLQALLPAGWTCPVDEIRWSGSHIKKHMRLHIQGVSIEPSLTPLKALGTMISSNSKTMTAVKHRRECMIKAFWKRSDWWFNTKSSLSSRLDLFQRLGWSTMLWGCEHWRMTKNELDVVRKTWRELLGYLLKIRRLPEESPGQYRIRCNKAINEVILNYKLEPWHVRALRSKFNWAGHLARFKSWCPDRFTHRCFQCRDNIFRKSTGIYQSCPGRPWRWEDSLVETFGDTWLDQALNKSKFEEDAARHAMSLGQALFKKTPKPSQRSQSSSSSSSSDDSS